MNVKRSFAMNGCSIWTIIFRSVIVCSTCFLSMTCCIDRILRAKRESSSFDRTRRTLPNAPFPTHLMISSPSITDSPGRAVRSRPEPAAALDASSATALAAAAAAALSFLGLLIQLKTPETKIPLFFRPRTLAGGGGGDASAAAAAERAPFAAYSSFEKRTEPENKKKNHLINDIKIDEYSVTRSNKQKHHESERNTL